MPSLSDYGPIVGTQTLEELRLLAGQLQGKMIQHVNSTAVGGGVAEILHRLIPLFKEIGVESCWEVIKGGERFFWATKKFHNALHGSPEEITPEVFDVYLQGAGEYLKEMPLKGDILFIHDPQPIVLVEKKKETGRKWIWRCHIDVSNPHPEVWNFLRRYIDQYDASVFSSPAFSQPLPIRQFMVAPSIDPLSEKNREIPEETITEVLRKYEIPRDLPIVTQISRFDRLKDPVGVIKAFRMVQKTSRCRLVLGGGTATDDPESNQVLEEVRQEADKDPLIHVLLIPSGSDLEINALQRASAVVLQKSLKEGFGLTVTEALWKAKPVVASAAGGIPLQVAHKYSGLLCHSIEGAAYALKQLLHNPGYAKRLGENGREHVRQNFLLTRHLREYLLLFLSLEHTEDLIRL
ncbi:MAG: glycosyltransferase [Candidatus Omnitrophica bacterium]|nr:glycosyltransferase [Candidatus Omnitrophota bacterium]